jgi:predicted secreted protein
VSRTVRGGLALLAVATLLTGPAGCARTKLYGEGTPTIVTAQGEQVVIELASNPTTGFSWALSGQPDPMVVTLMANDYAPSPSPTLGASGHQRWTFRAVGLGSTTIRFAHGRTWQQTPPDKTATFTVIVR